MAKKLDQKELVTFKELLISNSIQIEALTQLLVEKGVLTFEEVFEKLKEVQKNYKKPQDAQKTHTNAVFLYFALPNGFQSDSV